MSKKRRARFTGHSHIVGQRDPVREAEIAQRPTAAYKGDPVVQALMSRLSAPDCTEVEALNIGLALQGLLRGDAALVNNMDDPAVAEMVNRMRANRAEQDKAAEAFERDQEKFVEEVLNKADRIAPVGEKKDTTIAHGMQEYQSAMHKANAEKVNRRMRFTARLENDPKILVNVAPVYERTTINGVVGEVERPVVLRIMDRTFVLKAGQHMLPKILADEYDRVVRGRQENAERRQAMVNGTANAYQLAVKQQQIDAKYGSKGAVANVPPEV